MPIAKKPKRDPSEVAPPDPMAFIQAAAHQQIDAPEAPPKGKKRRMLRKEAVVIRFDADTLEALDQAAVERGLSRAALVRMWVIENLRRSS